MVSEINVFTVDEHGFKTHWKVGEGTTPEALTKLTQRQLELTQWLAGHNFKPDEMGKSTGSKPLPWKKNEEADDEPRERRNGRSHKSDVPECKYCGGPMWDNRNNKRSAKAPDFKCKDKDDCGGAAWEGANGLRWAEG